MPLKICLMALNGKASRVRFPPIADIRRFAHDVRVTNVTHSKRGKPPGRAAKLGIAVSLLALLCLLAALFFGPLM